MGKCARLRPLAQAVGYFRRGGLMGERVRYRTPAHLLLWERTPGSRFAPTLGLVANPLWGKWEVPQGNRSAPTLGLDGEFPLGKMSKLMGDLRGGRVAPTLGLEANSLWGK